MAAVVVSLGLLAALLSARGREGKGSEDLTTGTTAGGPPPAALLAAAPAASRAAGTARIRASQRGVEAGEPIDERVEGVYSFDTGAFDLTYAVEGPDAWDVVDLDDRAFSDGTTVWSPLPGRLRKLTYRLDLAGLLTDVALREDYVIEVCPEPSPALAARLRSGDRRAFAEMDALDEQCTERPARPEELVIEGSVELSDYGVPLAVTPPPPAQVLDGETFFEALLGSADDLFAAPTTSVRSRAAASTSTTRARSTSTSRPRATSTTRRS